MAAQKFVTSSLGCLLLIIGGSLAQSNPEGELNGAQEGMKGNPPQFIQDLDEGNRTVYFSIKFNNSLTKGQIVSAIQNWLQAMPPNVQTDYAKWQANITQMKDDFVNKLKANLTSDGSELFDKIQSAVDDQSINYTETCQQILNAINGSSQAAQEDLLSAVKDSFSGHIATQFGSNRQTDQSASSNHANMVAGGAVGASANGQPSLGMNNGHSRPGMNPCQQFMGAAGPHGGFTSKGMGAGPGSQMMPFQPQSGGQNGQNSQNGQSGPMSLQNGQMSGESQPDQKSKRGSESQSGQNGQNVILPFGQNGQNGFPPMAQNGLSVQNGQVGSQLGQMPGQMGGMMNGQMQPQHSQRRRRRNSDGKSGRNGSPTTGQNGQMLQPNGQSGQKRLHSLEQSGQKGKMPPMPGQSQSSQRRRRRQIEGQMTGLNGQFPQMGQMGPNGAQMVQPGSPMGPMGTGTVNGQLQQLPNGGLPPQLLPVPNGANNSNPGTGINNGKK
ncbi:hypothetical protein DdX_08535 [Ditylenchus destructor]|uniref:SXP/RAL-2 family protein Ani s 5-like cation-binding domain-containing protein n=1 Tax=Ditylenchus destructor TaxID=166010 RepID=A0AAD4R6Y7_9BILA|nr:hypothetical protein DdX_08535 [Ditylenchus destructor]